jgi:predicted transcriptional regulator
VSAPNVSPEKRASRRTRIPKRGLRLRDRDVDIVLAIAKMRLVRTTEIARLFFEAKGTAQKRLRKLFDAGLVRAVVTDLASENRFAITRLGHALLEEALDAEEVPAFRTPPKADGRSLLHLDLLNAYRVGLALGAREPSIELLRFRTDWELMAENPQSRLVPDALVSLGVGDRLFHLAVEVDTGTEALHLVRSKLGRYSELYATQRALFGVRIDALLFVVKTRRRARSIAKLVLGSSPAPAVLLGVPPVVTERGGLSCGLWAADKLLASTTAEEQGTEGILPGIVGTFRVRIGTELQSISGSRIALR